MSDFRFKTLEKYKTGGTRNNMELSIPLPKSPSGKTYRECPNEDCNPRLFLMGSATTTETPIPTEVVRRQPGTPGITCPYCGKDAPDQDFISKKDIEAAKKQVMWAATKDVGEEIGKMFKGLERKTRGSMISFKTKSVPSHRPQPRFNREDLLRNVSCNQCQHEYGVYAIGFFCPNCGANNLNAHFKRELKLIELQIENAAEQADEELAYRLLGNAHEDVVTAFETFQKTIYKKALNAQPNPPNEDGAVKIGSDFQNIEKSQKRFTKVGLVPFAALSTDELSTLRLNIEIRHVVGHNLGIADQKLEGLTEAYPEGTTVTLVRDEIFAFSRLCEKVINSLVEQTLSTAPKTKL